MKSTRDTELKTLFIDDGRKILDSLRRLFGAFDRKKFEPEIINQCFRHVHSLKSEASFLGYSGIVQAAENIETVLAKSRDGKASFDDAALAVLKSSFLSLNKDVRSVIQGLQIELSAGNRPEGREMEAEGFSPNEFETVVLKESFDRGERLYCIKAGIDESEPMPYPRLYLLINNLELSANVVKILPSLETLRKGTIYSLTVYITSRQEPEAIRRVLDVDQIKDSEISEVSFEEFIPPDTLNEKGRTAPRETRKYPRFKRGQKKNISVDFAVFESISLLIDCLSPDPGVFSQSLRELIGAYTGVPCSLVFEKARKMALDLSAKLGKKVHIETRGDLGTLISSTVFEGLNEILLHLVRNAVDHGIGTPSEREGMSKSPEGRILLEVKVKDGEYLIRVADDGRGIREKEVRDAAEVLGVDIPKDADLLRYLTHPGLSTKLGPSAVSGRGVGLDVVQGIVKDALGGRLELVTEYGKGSVFTIVFSDHGVGVPVFSVHRGDKKFVIPKVLVEEIFPLYGDAAVQTERGSMYRIGGGSFPVRTLDGGTIATDGVGLLLRGLPGSCIVLADEVTGETRVPLAEASSSVAVLLELARVL
jgi:two-component system chemotaxis sensor kinase CheA